VIFVLLPTDDPIEIAVERAAAVFGDFAAAVHGRVPDLHSIDLHTDVTRERGICGEHGRCVPTWQSLCPVCGGYLHDIAEVERLARLARWGESVGLYDRAGADRLRREKYKPVKLRKKKAA
jgi:hypothetical protein